MFTNEEKPKKPRSPRREFSAEFKAKAAKLVLEEGMSISQVARDLDLTESALQLSVEQTKTDRGEGKLGALTVAKREEIARLLLLRRRVEYAAPSSRRS